MTIIRPQRIESLDGFQNLDSDQRWKSHEPKFDHIPSEPDYKMEAMAAWWDMEGVRCATFGRDPHKNPYRE